MRVRDTPDQQDPPPSRACSALLAVLTITAATVGAVLFGSSSFRLYTVCNTIDDAAPVVRTMPLLLSPTTCKVDFAFAGGAANGSLVARCNETSTIAVCYDGRDPGGHAAVVRASTDPSDVAFVGIISLKEVLCMQYVGVALVGVAVVIGFASVVSYTRAT